MLKNHGCKHFMTLASLVLFLLELLLFFLTNSFSSQNHHLKLGILTKENSATVIDITEVMKLEEMSQGGWW